VTHVVTREDKGRARQLQYLIAGGTWMRESHARERQPSPVEIDTLEAIVGPAWNIADAEGGRLDRHLLLDIRNVEADRVAERVAEAFGFAVTLVYGTWGDPPSPIRVDPPRNLCALASLEDLSHSAWSVVEARPLDELELRMSLSTHWMIPLDALQIAIDLLPAVVEERHFRAASLYAASEKQFFVSPGDLGLVMEDEGERPRRGADRARLEGALTNAYKAVESLIGEPSSDDRRLRRSIEQLGIDPEIEVGFDIPYGVNTVQPLIEKIRSFQTARDRRGAHAARLSEPAPTYVELTDLQRCSRFVVLQAIQSALGRDAGERHD